MTICADPNYSRKVNLDHVHGRFCRARISGETTLLQGGRFTLVEQASKPVGHFSETVITTRASDLTEVFGASSA